MTRQEINKYLAAILVTALETEPDPFPESMAYLAMNSDMDKWTIIRELLSTAGLATFPGNSITLSDKGRVLANAIQTKGART